MFFFQNCKKNHNLDTKKVEFSVCGYILMVLSYIICFITLPISVFMCIKVGLRLYFRETDKSLLGRSRIWKSCDIPIGSIEKRGCERTRHILHYSLYRQLQENRFASCIIRCSSAGGKISNKDRFKISILDSLERFSDRCSGRCRLFPNFKCYSFSLKCWRYLISSLKLEYWLLFYSRCYKVYEASRSNHFA